MNDDHRLFQTTTAREDNPKAVFYGNIEQMITPLALYLTERNVELYSANELSDAFFGNYFFYIGDANTVEHFLEESGSRLPKTLILLTGDSDFMNKSIIDRLPQVKIVRFGIKANLSRVEAEAALAFFFGSDERVLTLASGQVAISAVARDVPVKPLVEPRELPQPQARQPTVSIEGSARFPESSAPPVDSETKNTLESIFKGSPKATGISSEGRKSLRLPFFKASIIVLVLVVIFPLVALGLELSLGSLHLFFAYKSWQDASFSSLEKDLKGARFFFRAAEINSETISGLFTIVHGQRLYRELHQLASTARRASQGTLYLVEAAKDGETLINGITGREKGVSFGQVISAVKGNLTLADTELGLVEAELETEALRDFFSGSRLAIIRDTYPKLGQQLSLIRQVVATARGGLAVVPEATGFYGKRTYLVVFQNNMELRPTGGFIGSYGLVNFVDGVFNEFTIEDVYVADGALKGHIDPPEPIRTHLGQEHWYMRDGNWDPDFSRSGARLAWFLDKEIEVAVDGVVAVDLAFVQSLLEVVGPLRVADYPDNITTDNLFETAQSASETEFFPGSTQKKDFLGAVGRALIRALLEDRDLSQVALLQPVHEALASRHLLFYFVDPATQGLTESLGWTGTFAWPLTCQTACVPDFLSVVDANLGVNKVNYYIKREVVDRVDLTEDGRINHQLTITYKNDSTEAASKIGGTYKNYVRVYVPVENELTDATVDSLPLTLTTGSVASGSTITSTAEGEFRVFAGLVEVPPQAEKKLNLTYARQIPDSQENLFTYAYQLQKQSGTAADTLRVAIHYPSSWRPVSRYGGGEVSGASTLVKNQEISYNSDLSKDRLIEVDFNLN